MTLESDTFYIFWVKSANITFGVPFLPIRMKYDILQWLPTKSNRRSISPRCREFHEAGTWDFCKLIRMRPALCSVDCASAREYFMNVGGSLTENQCSRLNGSFGRKFRVKHASQPLLGSQAEGTEGLAMVVFKFFTALCTPSCIFYRLTFFCRDLDIHKG